MNRDNDKGKVLIKRSLILGLGEFLLFMVIIARLYYLQDIRLTATRLWLMRIGFPPVCLFRRGGLFMTAIRLFWLLTGKIFRL